MNEKLFNEPPAFEDKTIPNNGEITLKEVVLQMRSWRRQIISRWKILLLYAFIGGILGFGYAYLKAPVYVADATFVLEDGDNGTSGQYSNLASAFGVNLGSGGGGIFKGDNILELYKSRTMVIKTLLSSVNGGNKGLLIDRFIEINNFRENWQNPLLKNIKFSSSDPQKFSRLQDSVLQQVVEMINKSYLNITKPDKSLNIIQVTVKSKDESFSKDFNNQIVKNVNDFYVQTKTKKAIQNLFILQRQTDSVRNVLNGAVYASVQVADATPNLNPTKQVLRAPAQRSQVIADANRVILGELVKNLEMAKLSLRKETPLIQSIDQPMYPLLKKQPGTISSSIIGIVLGAIFAIFIVTLKSIYNKLIN